MALWNWGRPKVDHQRRDNTRYGPEAVAGSLMPRDPPPGVSSCPTCTVVVITLLGASVAPAQVRRRRGFGLSPLLSCQDEVGRVLMIANHSEPAVVAFYRTLHARRIIGEAKGVLMERYGVDAGVATGLLVQARKERSVELHVVAQDVVDDVTWNHR